LARLQTGAVLRNYLKERVKVEFDRFYQSEGHIGEALDEATGLVDEVMTSGNILTIRGSGIKIDGDDANKAKVGLFFIHAGSGQPFKAAAIAVNEPRTIKAVVPTFPAPPAHYHISIKTQTSAKGGGALLKNIREVRSDFTLSPA
jgi:hypothetical protein